MFETTMDIRVPTPKEAKKFRQRARDEYISCGQKAVTNDFRIVTIVWVCPKGCTHPSHYAFHKNISSLQQLADEYYIDFEDRRIGDDLTERVEAYRFSNTNWELLNKDDPAPPNGSILVINHVLVNGIWYVSHYGRPNEEKRCNWCFKPGAKEKCSWCVQDSVKNPKHIVARYCNRECQKAHFPAHKANKIDASGSEKTVSLVTNDTSPKGEQSCAHCSKPAVLASCAKCGKATYCSKDCQIAHWPKHKLDCAK
jgi:hypothetical protein